MKYTILSALCAACLCTGCDQGDIYPEEDRGTRNVNVQTLITNSAGWPGETYSLVLAVFEPGSDTPVDTVGLPRAREGKQSVISLNSIPDHASAAAVCLVKRRTKEVVYTFYSETLSPEKDLTILGVNSIDLLPYQRVQKQLLSQCVQCHGASVGQSAAGLDLTEGNSYAQMVNHPSTYSPNLRVKPGSPNESFIVDILDGSGTSLLERPYNHSTGISSLTEDDLDMLKAWIKTMQE